MKNVTNLGDDAIADLRLALQPLIQTTLDEHSEATRPGVPMDNILGVVVETAKKAASDQGALNRYLEDLDKRKSFSEQMAAQTYAYYIDSFVGLSTKQWEEVRRGGTTLYRRGDLDPENLRYWGGPVAGYGSVPKANLELLKDILTTDQMSYLEKFTQMRGDPESREQLTQALRLLAEMKVQQLDAEVTLSRAQKQKLEFVSKNTIVPRVVARRIRAKSLQETYIKARINDPNAEFTEEDRHEAPVQFPR